MKYFSTFSGIGGFELGIHSSIPDAVCVGFSEVNKYASSIYQHHFKTHKNYGDVTKIIAEELPDFDMLVGGFPCQAFSIAGKRKGFDDTRGTLFFDLARILRAKQPRLFVFENVKGLLSHDNGNTFRTIIATLDELGYDVQWQVVNSKNHGVPQNRERVYIVGHRSGTERPIVFPMNMVQCENDKTTINEKVYQMSNGVSSYSRELLLGMAQQEEQKLSRQQMQDLFTRIEQGLQTEECREVERESQEIRQQSEGDLQEVETLGAFLGSQNDTGAVCGVVSIPTEDMLLLWTQGGDALQNQGQLQQQDTSTDNRQARLKETLRTWEHSPLLFAVQPYQGKLFYSIGDGKDWVNIYQTKVEITWKENNLSCILEEQPDPKYFLSPKQMEAILSKSISLDTQTIESTQLMESAPLSTPCKVETGNLLSESPKLQSKDMPSQDQETQLTYPSQTVKQDVEELGGV